MIRIMDMDSLEFEPEKSAGPEPIHAVPRLALQEFEAPSAPQRPVRGDMDAFLRKMYAYRRSIAKV